MSYKIIGTDGEVKKHKGKEVLGSDLLGVKTIIDPDKRIVEVPVSSDRQDRDGDRIIQEGIDRSNARSVLYAHDYGYSFVPIGKILGTRMEKLEGFIRTLEQHQFPQPGKHELSDVCWNMIEFGALNATSIGFISKIIVRAESDDARDELGLGRWGVLFQEIEQLETSWVPVGSNREAFRQAYGKGVLKRSETGLLFPDSWHEINAPDHWTVGIEFEEKDLPKADESAEDIIEDLELADKIEADDSQEEKETIEQRLDKIEATLEKLTRRNDGGQAQAHNLEPEPDAQEKEAAPEGEQKTETQSLTKDQVSEIMADVLDSAVKKLGDIVDKRLNDKLGIVP